MTLKEEAELYSTMTMFYNAETKEIPTEKQIMEYEYVSEIAFKAGANSKWVQAEKIRAQISENESVLEMLKVHGNDSSKFRVSMRIDQLRQQLKELENENI